MPLRSPVVVVVVMVAGGGTAYTVRVSIGITQSFRSGVGGGKKAGERDYSPPPRSGGSGGGVTPKRWWLISEASRRQEGRAGSSGRGDETDHVKTFQYHFQRSNVGGMRGLNT